MTKYDKTLHQNIKLVSGALQNFRRASQTKCFERLVKSKCSYKLIIGVLLLLKSILPFRHKEMSLNIGNKMKVCLALTILCSIGKKIHGMRII